MSQGGTNGGGTSGMPPPPHRVEPPPVAPPVSPPKTSGFAIASLVFGILGGVVLALVFGYVALSKIKRSGGALTGRGMALAGVILGWAWLALLGVGIFAAVTSGPRDLPADAVCGELFEDVVTEVPCTSPRANVYLKDNHPRGSDPEVVCPAFSAVYTIDEEGRVECWSYI